MKKALSLFLSIIMVFSCISGLSFVSAGAVAYTPRLTAPSYENPYFIHTSYGGLNECILIENNSVLPNCVGYAWGRAYEILGTRPNLSKGNANTFFNYNKNGGYYPYGQEPRAGAVLSWGCYTYGHVAVVEKVENGIVTISQSSYGGERFNTKSGTEAQIEGMLPDFHGYIYLGDFDTNNPPKTQLDEITGQTGSVKVRGWAFDEDDLSKSLEIHVYIGGKAGAEGAVCNIITADVKRTDVNSVYDCGDYHGFKADVPTNLTGQQPVYVYAIDNEGNDNTLIGSSTVTITADTEKPEVGDVEVVSSNSKGFTLSVPVSDNGVIDVVRFPTWTKEDHSDIVWYDGTVENGVATCEVQIADFDGVNGQYFTDVYVYDYAGNVNGTGGFSTTYNMPKGQLDDVLGKDGGVYLRGWAFDADDTEQSLTIHAYIGGNVGEENVEFFEFVASMKREDVDNVFGSGKNHGFEETLMTTHSGEQPIYVYALNVGNGSNKLIYSGTVDIPSDTELPVIEDAKIIATSKDSYTVSCTVTDNCGIKEVKFASWNIDDYQNVVWQTGEVSSDGVVTCKVNVNDFSLTEGNFATHIYAYDLHGNLNKYLVQTSFNLPEGMIDEITGKSGRVFVRGWAFDADALDEALEIHVYIGGEGTGVADALDGGKFDADKLREDVDAKYNCGPNHGFDISLRTNVTGEQPIYVYAINKGNGENVFLGKSTVTINKAVYGDADSSGELSVMDATRIQQALALITELTDEESFVSDVTGDDVVSISDATYIQMYLASLIDKFPVL